MLATIQNILCFLMLLIADGVNIIARGCNDEHQRLFPGITGAFGQSVEQLIVWLCMELIKTQTVDRKPVFARCICR